MPSSAAAAFSDAALLIAVQAGDHSLSSVFFERFTPRVAGIVRKLRPSRDEHYCDDAISNTMLTLLRPSITRFVAADGTIVQYLFRRVRNAVKKTDREHRPFVTHRKADPKREEVVRSDREATVVYDHTMRGEFEPSPVGDIEHRDAMAFVLAKADPIDSQIARMRYVEDMAVMEIALQIGLNRFAVARRLKRFQSDALAVLAMANAA